MIINFVKIACIGLILLLGSCGFTMAKDPFVKFSANGDYIFKEAVYDSKYDHSKKNSPYLLLPYTLVHTAETKDKMPIFYLRGGPGLSGTSIASDLKEGKTVPAIFKRLLKQHPIYFIDQRGTGIFKPSMWCSTKEQFKDPVIHDKADFIAFRTKQIKYCKKEHKRFSIHTKFLDSLSVARDINLLRKHIGAQKIIIFGESYGTNLALTYLRHFEDTIHKMILIGVAGPDHMVFLPNQYEDTLKLIDANRLSASMAPLLPKIKAVLAKYDQGERPLNLSKFEFLWLVMDHYYQNTGSELMDILKDDKEDLVEKYTDDLSYKRGVNFKYLAAICATYGSDERITLAKEQSKTALVGDALIMQYELCKEIDIKPLPKTHRVPIKSHIPTLAFSGRLDFKTPPKQADEIGKGFSNFIHVINDSGAHNYCKKEECHLALERFLKMPPRKIKSKTIILE